MNIFRYKDLERLELNLKYKKSSTRLKMALSLPPYDYNTFGIPYKIVQCHNNFTK